jgi:aminopeptidase
VAEGSVAEGSVAEGSVAEGSVAEGSVAEGSVAEGSVAEGSEAEGSVAEGSVAEGSEAEGLLTPPARYVEALTELVVGIGANIQPGQVVGITMQSGQETITRAVAEAAYARGATYVDVWLFDLYLKHSRLKHADRDTLAYVPEWVRQRMLQLGEMNAARISFQGSSAPRLMDDIDADRLGLDIMPRLRESTQVTMKQLTNWTIVPWPNPDWASMVHPGLSAADAYERLWEEIAFICRLNEDDPAAAWNARLETLERGAAQLTEMRLDALHFVGPGTDLTIGLLPSSRWIAGRMKSATGISFAANIPTEEVFTAPDPMRVDGFVTATKPLLIPGASRIEGLTVRFEGGRAVEFNAERGVELLRGMASRDEGACRLGEVALVDHESRVGRSGTVFSDILLDENSASHIALGAAYPFSVADEQDKARANVSEIHIDFMIGSDDVVVDGVRTDGSVVPLLRGGVWQI